MSFALYALCGQSERTRTRKAGACLFQLSLSVPGTKKALHEMSDLNPMHVVGMLSQTTAQEGSV